MANECAETATGVCAGDSYARGKYPLHRGSCSSRMKGDVAALGRIAKKDHRADRAQKKLSRRHRDRKEWPANRTVTAVRHTEFAFTGLPDVDRRLFDKASALLMNNKDHRQHAGRRMYNFVDVFDRKALLIAPRKEEYRGEIASTLADLDHLLKERRVYSGPEYYDDEKNRTRWVKLLTCTVPVDACLDGGSTCDDWANTEGVHVAIRRYNVGPFVVFSLVRSSERFFELGSECRRPDDNTPKALGLGPNGFASLQREAAKLLGLRLLCDWAL